MYFKVHVNMFQHKDLKNLSDIFLYSFLCGFAKEDQKEVYSHYTNQQLVDIFGCSSQTISNSITRLVKLGLVKRYEDTRFSESHCDFFCRRTIVADTTLYRSYAGEHYLSVNTNWLSDWKLPFRAVQLLALFWSSYFMNNSRIVEFTTEQVMDIMGNVNYRTYINNYNLLEELGLIKVNSEKHEQYKCIELCVEYLGEEVNPEEVLGSAVETESIKSSVGKLKSVISYFTKYLRQKSSKVVKNLLHKLDPSITVKRTLEPLWQAFDYYDRLSIRSRIPEDADPRDGYFVQGEGYA
nr:MAG TPA: replication initiator protein [Caudoviricetes sp.]